MVIATVLKILLLYSIEIFNCAQDNTEKSRNTLVNILSSC